MFSIDGVNVGVDVGIDDGVSVDDVGADDDGVSVDVVGADVGVDVGAPYHPLPSV